MARKLPPLNSLRAFEAAARLLSFTRAGEELCVTQAAISHQIKTLEAHLELNLFTRLHRRLLLTKAGQQLLLAMQQSFDQMAQAVADIQQQQGQKILKVRLAPSFAAKWLSPRLKQFRDLHPDIDLNLFHASDPVDFACEDIDVALTYGRGDWPGVECFPLMQLDFFPVCSPSLLVNRKKIAVPANLSAYPLLHDANYHSWENWLLQVGASQVNAKRGTIIDDTNVLIQAAVDGQGIALGSSSFVADHIQTGRLVRLFDQALVTDYAYYFVCPKEYLQRHSVIAFRQWLLIQVNGDQHSKGDGFS